MPAPARCSSKGRDDSTGIIYWDVPYEPGTLRVEGIDKNGKAVADYEIKTYGEASKVKAVNLPILSQPLPNPPLKGRELGGKGKVVHLLIDIVDTQGNRVLNYRNDVKCEVLSGGKLLGLENANNSDMSAPKQPHKNANRGRLLAYIQRNAPSQSVRVRITAEGLSPIEVTL